ncbi:single-stranded-DNA-specific exonuclease RecJ [Sulfuricaulis sp.]|jgi:single-stranded-DNA-specific exonuclease|uniref:single-stranded-DNA-specific exonuclease RecJ n=1 Tax=Sulfuricaulis sp. TaxID=2003553 RepID=UPI003559A331
MTHAKIISRRPPGESGNLPDDLHPVLRRIYLARHVTSAQELEQSLDRLIPPTQLKGIDQATALLADALQRQRRILIVADFDADGATSCALALRALRAMGARDVRYLVPNRFEYGYGLTPEIVALAAQQSPELIITVDNGISSLEGVAEARRRGIDVLVTDHHLPGATLPMATMIVNPNQPDDHFPSKNLAGVGVIFYVTLALRARLRESGWFAQQNIPEPNLARLLDLVALGTVADVVPLDYNNRILVAQGLKRINQGNPCAGIAALLRVAGRSPQRVTAMDLGYVVGPRLNAAGRLTDMSLGIECLLTDDCAAAQDMAGKLDALNRERRTIEASMQEQAFAAIASLHLDMATLPRGLCLFDESWHQGVIGLVASRIKEHTHRPVIAFAPANDSEIKGSARSVPGLHIRDALDAVAARHPQLLSRFGGHAMAAGLTLLRAHLEAFREAFDEEVSRHLSDSDLQGRIISDGELTGEELTLPVAELLRAAGPWGQGFPEPVFDGCFDVVSQRVVGEKHLKLTLRAPHHTKTLEAIAFNRVREGQAVTYSRIRTAYKLDVNEYQGYRSLQLIIEHLEHADTAISNVEPATTS